ncbi:hypothetical protein DCC79_03810 [bacterium]|nr:MAG: hypothetical protein DCC79_03810 [bacterium]
MTTTLVVPGIAWQPPADDVDRQMLDRFGLKVTTRRAVRMGPAARGAADVVRIPDAPDDAVVELTYPDQTREWLRVDELRRRIGPSARGGESRAELVVPPALGVATTRGAFDLVLEGLKLFDIDPIGDWSKTTVVDMVDAFESKLFGQPAPGHPAQRAAESDCTPRLGLNRIDAAGRLEPVVGPLPAGAGQPYLILLHGTFSSTCGSFGRLMGSPEWAWLHERYGDRILGFDHYSLSQSPARNALDLAQSLPDGARLDLLSHSRGGVVGELLSLRELPPSALSHFEVAGRDGDIDDLRALLRVRAEKQLRVERFVRVAGPARGVWFIHRLDRYLSILLNLLELVPAFSAGPLFPFAKAVVLSLIRRSADPATVPGIEAIMPSSPFIDLVNQHGLGAEGRLAVVAGDAEGRGFAGRLKTLAVDGLLREINDLLVETRSMYGGLARAEDKAVFAFHRGPDVCHTTYFANDASRKSLCAWLAGRDQPPSSAFRALTPEAVAVAEAQRDRSRGRRTGAGGRAAPIGMVLVVPDVMASHLKDDRGRIWLDPARLREDGIEPLRLADDGEPGGIRPDGLFDTTYDRLIDALSGRFEVAPFATDWRRSIRAEGARLADEISRRLTSQALPLHVVAHGAGGLVARAVMADHPEAWSELGQRGGRLVMLGTPHAGMFQTLRLLTGEADIVRQVALLDPRRDDGRAAAMLRTLPGIVELVPHALTAAGAAAPAAAAAWWTEPAFQARLRAAAECHTALERAVDAARMVCVVGSADTTPAGLCEDHDGRLTTCDADGGDGWVTDDRAALPGVPVWRVPNAHGDMPRAESVVTGIAEILERGDGANLPQASLPTRGARRGFTPPAAVPLLFPTAPEMLAAATGGTPPGVPEADAFVLRLSVAHGSLEHARHPVLVGHYAGDSIAGPEAVIDRWLDGRLTRRHAMGLYPGAVGTADVLLAPGSKPPGCLVVGLGEVGGISPGLLTDGVAAAALRYALSVMERPAAGDEALGWCSAAFCALLVGSNTQTFTVQNSVAAIVGGALLANRMLREQNLWDRVRIDAVQFVEIYEDVATVAATTVRDIHQHLRVHLDISERLQAEPYLESLDGGLLRRPVAIYADNWWRRLQVRERTDCVAPGAAADGDAQLEFTLLTDRAGAGMTLQPAQRRLVDQLIARTVGRSDDLDVPATLYEMLLPNALKERAYELAGLQLVLDPAAARYPWEMLAERGRDGQAIPLAARMGIVRQLTTAAFQPRLRPPAGRNALVIGDPDLGAQTRFARLPGAAVEAREVAALLRTFGYDVFELVGTAASAVSIVKALFARDYRIVHIAAHGVFDPLRKDRTGVVIGADVYLTPGEIAQMRVMPELVFLNCCHSGTTAAGPDDVEPADTTDAGGTGAASTQGSAAQGQPPAGAGGAPDPATSAWHHLASNVSEALIHQGVSAVVAAGWAVNDAAALDFARELYRHLTGNRRTFGDAVFRARKHLFEHAAHRRTNTWGAYQCYGDPAFRLRAGGNPPPREPAPAVALHEVIRELDELARRGAAGDDDTRRHSLARVRHLATSGHQAWARHGRLQYRLANALAELGDLEGAVASYRRALETSSDAEDVPIRAVEQLANLESRLGEHLWREGGPREQSLNLLEQARTRMEVVLAIHQTPERLAIAGATERRLAAILDTADDAAAREAALRRAAAHYKAAFEAGETPLEPDPYPALAWIDLACVLGDGETSGLENLAQTCLQRARELAAAEPSYWHRVYVPDAEKSLALVRGDLPAHAAAIRTKYAATFALGATLRERDSTVGYLRWLAAMLEWRSRDADAAALREIAAAPDG